MKLQKFGRYDEMKAESDNNELLTENEAEGEDLEQYEDSGDKKDGYFWDENSGEGYFDIDLKKPKVSLSYSLICFFIVLALTAASIAAVNLNRSSITVTMNFPEIANGNNPDSSPFDIYDFVSNDVLELTCEKLDNRIDVDTLWDHLWIDGKTSQQSFNSVYQNILDGAETSSYFPSSYNVTYSVISDNVRDYGPASVISSVFKQLSLPSKSEILTAFGEAYSEHYNDAYVNTGDVLEIDWGNTGELDYYNRIYEINTIINKMSRYLNERYNEAVTFVSSDGISFGDLAAELSRIVSVDVNNYQAFVVQNGITSDKDRLLLQLRNVSFRNSEQYSRSIAEYNVMLEGIELYDPNITKVVFVPALDEENEFYMNRTQIGIDYLTNSAEKAKLSADEAKNTVDQYDSLIAQFTAAPWPSDQLKAQAEEMYKNIVSKLNDFSKRAAALNNDYINSEVYEGVNIQAVSNGAGLMSSAVTAVKTAVIASAFLYSLNFLYTEIKKFVQKKRGNADEEGEGQYDRS